MSRKDTLELARQLRQQMSLPEMLVWTRIKVRERDAPVWRRQTPVGPYVADFYCARAMLIVEVDGASHDHGDRPERDDRRTAWLEKQGYMVMRIPAADVLRDPDDIVQGLLNLARDRVLARRKL